MSWTSSIRREVLIVQWKGNAYPVYVRYLGVRARHVVLQFLLGALLPGCTTLPPKNESVRLTNVVSDVDGCRAVGYVQANPPFMGPNGWENRLKGQAAALGADVVLHEAPLVGSVKGRAYGCRGRDAKPASTRLVLRPPPSQHPSAADKTTGVAFQEEDLKMTKESMSRLRQIAIAVETYAVDQNVYPAATTMDELISLLVPRCAKMLPRTDAWGIVLSYEVATDRTHYRLMSPGADRTFQIESLVTPIGFLHPGPQMDLAADIVFEDGVFVQWPDARP